MFTLPKEQEKNYNGIDLIKVLCAIMVFIIHIPPFQGKVSGIANHVNFILQDFICRIAVPFYFISSGFLLFKNMPLYNLDNEKIKSYCFKILRLLGIWYVLTFIGGTGHLWYLGATVIAVVLLSLCFHFRIRLGYIYVIACALYVIGLFGDSYYGIIAPLENIKIFHYIFKGYTLVFSTTRNGVFMGFIFVLIGATFSNCRIRLKTTTSLIGLVVSVLCLFIEAVLLKHNNIPFDCNMYVFLLPVSFFLFSLAISAKLKDRPVYKHLRNIGTLVYFSHLMINWVTLLVLSAVEQYFHIAITQYIFVVTLLFTLLFAIFIEWLSGKNKFKWISWLVS